MFGRLSTPEGWLRQSGGRAGQDAADGQEAAEYLALVFRDGWTNGDDGMVGRLERVPQPWGFELDAIAAPVSLWHRLADTRCPPGHSRWLAERIPHITAHFPEQEDHQHRGQQPRRRLRMAPLARPELFPAEVTADRPEVERGRRDANPAGGIA